MSVVVAAVVSVLRNAANSYHHIVGFTTSSAPAPLFFESAIFFSIFLRWSLIDVNFNHASSAVKYNISNGADTCSIITIGQLNFVLTLIAIKYVPSPV